MLKTAILSGLLLSAAAIGAEARDMGPGPIPGFEELDANQDGFLSLEEAQAHMSARFEAADADGDGMLSEGELVEQMRARAEDMAAQMLARRDADGDGVLSQDEMRPRGNMMGHMFTVMDADQDGLVSAAEFEEGRHRQFRGCMMRGGHSGGHTIGHGHGGNYGGGHMMDGDCENGHGRHITCDTE